PLILAERFGYSGAAIGGLIAVPPAIGAAGVLVLPWASERAIRAGISVRAARGVATGAISVVSGIAAFLTPLASGTSAVVLVSVALGLPSTAYRMMFLMMGRISPVWCRGALMSVVAGVITLCGIVAPWFFGLIAGSVSSKHLGYDLG